VVVGIGVSAAIDVATQAGLVFDNRSQKRRILTFMLGGKDELPPLVAFQLTAQPDPDYKPNPTLEAQGALIYSANCISCHGFNAMSAGNAPDLRGSAVPSSASAFESVMHEGALVQHGMPRFDEFSPDDLAALRQYLRSRAAALRSAGSSH
jgi:quinohemoprotein ethanol dehydrogenase